MARNKFPEETMNLILDVSTKLFLEKGYENTTMGDIVADLGGLTRGAIYHHFKNKEEILEAVMTRMFSENNLLAKIEQEKNVTGLQKIKKLIMYSLTSTEQQQLYTFSLSLMKNTRLLARQLEEAVTELAPLIEKWIIEGYEDGSIQAENSKETAETIAILLNIWANPSVFLVTKKQLISKFQYMRRLFDSLGIPIIDNEVMKACLKYTNNILLE
ncbi:TetR/AcrR family transcriptional regulator [Anaerophilus nitritogenes]|uniref:TetR/AcrR family transcriptional regulator n=1 Tax=Anaerophilus nitritogenes TaxID=2498136 RepID=UPI00101D935B|nr:TetR/AcrR family transcriptional regulator [Anaerophilus nitritogenes]